MAGPIGFALVVALILGGQVLWAARSIRREFASRGLRVVGVRWQPVAPLLSFRFTREHMLYAVRYVDTDGEPRRCRVVASVSGGYRVEGDRPDVARGVGARLDAVSGFTGLCAGGSAVCTLVLGATYWTVPYASLELPDDLSLVGLLLVALAAGGLTFARPDRWRAAFLLPALAPTATVLVRVALDVATHPSSHNLFPFEVAIALGIGALASSAGVGVALLARAFAPRTR